MRTEKEIKERIKNYKDEKAKLSPTSSIHTIFRLGCEIEVLNWVLEGKSEADVIDPDLFYKMLTLGNDVFVKKYGGFLTHGKKER